MTDKQILQKWCATYGENDEDIRATMWSADGMIEFAKEYHQEQLKLYGVGISKPVKKKTPFDLAQEIIESAVKCADLARDVRDGNFTQTIEDKTLS